MASDDKNEQDTGTGFAGLSSMVSDVDDVVVSTPKQSQKATPEPASKQSAEKSQQAKQTQTRPASQTYQEPAQPSGGSSAGKWLLGIAVVIGLIWLANQSDNNRPSKPTYYPGAPSTSRAPAGQPAIAQPQAPSRPSESKPSVGRNKVLSTAQIRYCLAEKIRLDAAETVLNNYSDSDVDRFNGYVNDYNSRCGEFRYRQGALERARRDVNPYRSQLQVEGRSKFISIPPPSSTSTPTPTPTPTTSWELTPDTKRVPALAPAPASTSKPSRLTPDATVQAVQRRLNELGYNAGPADGIFGKKTRAAIQAFQTENGMNSDGKASKELLQKALAAKRKKSNAYITDQKDNVNGALKSETRQPDLSGLSHSERQSIEAACNTDKYVNGPAAYNKCLRNQLSAMSGQAGSPDLSKLSRSELQSIEAACNTDKYVNGPAAYNKCLRNQLSAMSGQPGRPDLSKLSRSELQSIEAACNTDKYVNGPAAYNKCLRNQLSAMSGQAGSPDLSKLSRSELQSIEAACNTDKYVNGPAAYNKCLRNQLSAMSGQPGRPDLSKLSRSELQSIESACNTDKYVNGPSAYNRCLRNQLARLRN